MAAWVTASAPSEFAAAIIRIMVHKCFRHTTDPQDSKSPLIRTSPRTGSRHPCYDMERVVRGRRERAEHKRSAFERLLTR